MSLWIIKLQIVAITKKLIPTLKRAWAYKLSIHGEELNRYKFLIVVGLDVNPSPIVLISILIYNKDNDGEINVARALQIYPDKVKKAGEKTGTNSRKRVSGV